MYNTNLKIRSSGTVTSLVPTQRQMSMAVSVLRLGEQSSIHHGSYLPGLCKHLSLLHPVYTFLSGSSFMLNYDVSQIF